MPFSINNVCNCKQFSLKSVEILLKFVYHFLLTMYVILFQGNLECLQLVVRKCHLDMHLEEMEVHDSPLEGNRNLHQLLVVQYQVDQIPLPTTKNQHLQMVLFALHRVVRDQNLLHLHVMFLPTYIQRPVDR